MGQRATALVAEALRQETRARRSCAEDVINKYALLVQGTARKNLNDDPRRIDEGRLRSSIQTMITGLFAAKLAGIVYTDLEYAPFVHYGTGRFGEHPSGGHRLTPWVYYDEKRRTFVLTSGMRPNKFLLNAFNEHRRAMLQELEQCLGRPPKGVIKVTRG